MNIEQFTLLLGAIVGAAVTIFGALTAFFNSKSKHRDDIIDEKMSALKERIDVQDKTIDALKDEVVFWKTEVSERDKIIAQDKATISILSGKVKDLETRLEVLEK